MISDELEALLEAVNQNEQEAKAAWLAVVGHGDFAALPVAAQAYCLNRLGHVCWQRFWTEGETADLHTAIAAWQTAVVHTPTTDNDFPLLHTHLSAAFHARFDQTHERDDLETAVAHAQQAIAAAPPDFVHAAALYNNLGSVLRARYQQDGKLADLDAALAAWEEALGLIANEHPERPSILHNTALGLLERFEREGDEADLQQGIAYCQTAVFLPAAKANDRPFFYNTLGIIMMAAYRQRGWPADLETAIQAWQTAVEQTPLASVALPRHLNNLGNGWRAKYEQSGQQADLEQAIILWQKAVQLTPPTSSERAQHLLNLATGYQLRYAHSQQTADLDAAIDHYQTAVALTATTSPARPLRLANLGTGYLARYDVQGEIADLEAALAVYETAVAETPSTASDYPHVLVSYGQGLQSRFVRWGQMDDLTQAIKYLQQACDLIPKTAVNYPLYAHQLAEGLRRRYQLLGKMADLEAAIAVAEAALLQVSATAVQRAELLNGVGVLRHARYLALGEMADWQTAVQQLQAAVDLVTGDNSTRALYRTNLGSCWQDGYRQSGDMAHLDRAVQCHMEAVALLPETAVYYPMTLNNLGAALNLRYKASANAIDSEVARNAYKTACQRGLVQAPYITLQAAQSWGNWAMEREAWVEALNAYAYGSQVMATLYPRQISQTMSNVWLRQGWRLYLQIAYAQARQGDCRAAVLTLERERTRWLQMELGATAEETMTWAEITAVSQQPLLYLLISHVGGLALLVYRGAVTPIWFAGDETTWNRRLLHQLETEEPAGYLAAQLGAISLPTALNELLPWLGKVVMEPVRDAVQPVVGAGGATLTLIPTGRLALFPWHAAQGSDGACWLADCAFRYAPSAQVLWRSQQRPAAATPPHLFAVANPTAVGLPDLPYVGWETAVITPYFQPHVQAFQGTGVEKTAVLGSLTTAHYLHFACHGQFDWQNPLAASLVLSGDMALTVADMRQMVGLTAVRLVFLSACQTGMVDFDQAPDEAISLATAFLQAGAKGVVATLWPVPDLSTALLVQRFYQHHVTEALSLACSLRLAQRWLAQQTAAELANRFAHAYRRATQQQPLLLAAWRRFADLDGEERPFAHPYYWAAFALTGT